MVSNLEQAKLFLATLLDCPYQICQIWFITLGTSRHHSVTFGYTACYLVFADSGTSGVQENRFLVTVIRDLLSLVEITRGKAHKAVIASNIM
jgi:hypothetical protein